MLTDYGDIPLPQLKATQVFSPQRIVGTDSKFTRTVAIAVGHTYGVLINKSGRRGFVYFRVLDHGRNQKVVIEYAVMDYSVNREFVSAAGFSWDATPHN